MTLRLFKLKLKIITIVIGHFKVEQHKEAKSIIKHNENSIEENVTESYTFTLQWKGILQQFFFVLLTRKDVEQTYNKILVLLQLKKDKVF